MTLPKAHLVRKRGIGEPCRTRCGRRLTPAIWIEDTSRWGAVLVSRRCVACDDARGVELVELELRRELGDGWRRELDERWRG